MTIIIVILSLVTGIVAFYLLGAALVGNYYGNGDDMTESRKVEHIKEIEFKSFGKLVITQSSVEDLTVHTKRGYASHVLSHSEGSTLRLQEKDDIAYNFYAWALPKPTYTVHVKDLSRIAMSGMGDVEVTKLDTKSLVIETKGMGSFTANINVSDDLSVRISGLLNVSLAGTAKNQMVDSSGDTKYTALDLQSQTASLRVGGNSKASVNVSNLLRAKAYGNGSITYKGSPQIEYDNTDSRKVQPNK